MKKSLWILLCLFLLLSTSGWLWHQRKNRISYNRDIRPIFNAKCLACHGGIKKSGGFSLLFPEEALDTTDSGFPSIIPGKASKSELIQRLRHHDKDERMPQEADPLSEEEIKIIEKWINQGAKWETHWAYIPPKSNIKSPRVSYRNWVRNKIDAFILNRLEAERLLPNKEADKEVLLRRVSLDLIGLPPTQQELEHFLSDTSKHAYEKAVDRLLTSSHFGEKWASMWLDLARYADSKGYEKDLYRSIWKYRDWVIQALNDDMPFDQFTTEQLAGDLLPNPSESQYIATAFHRNTMANDEGGTDNEEFRNYANIERVGTTFEVWQGTTMACVQCHSHPYDPFRHEDFYNFMAFFNNTADKDIYHEGPNLFTYEREDKEEMERIMGWLKKNLKLGDKLSSDGFLHEQKADLLYRMGHRKLEVEYFDESSSFIELTSPEQTTIFQVQDTSWVMFEDIDLTNIEAISYRYATPYSGFIELRLGSQFGKMISRTSLVATASPNDRKRWEKWRTIKVPVKETRGKHDIYFVFKKDRHNHQDLFRIDWFFFHGKNPRMNAYDDEFRNMLDTLEKIKPVPTPIMRDLPPEHRRVTRLFERGNWLNPGREVSEAIPTVLGGLPEDMPKNRLAMAKWLVSPKNPLTSRVIVNRFWEKIFGYGIVESVEDFGTQGIPPTHPELLDWLAVEFMETHNWSMKALLKQIVMSATYRQSAVVTEEKLTKDPRNLLLSRAPRLRLSAEQLRDQVLAASGLLNPKMFGPSVKPPLPEGTGRFGFGDRWELSEEEDFYRRSLYVYLKRTNPFPNRMAFDATDRTICTSRRIRTNTPLQALAQLNDDTYLEASEALANVILKQAHNIDQQIAFGYRRLMLRSIDSTKLDRFKELYQDALIHYGMKTDEICNLLSNSPDPTPQLAAMTLVANAMFNLDEFITKN